MPPLLKPTQVAARWSCSPRHVCRLAESGALRGLKAGSLWRFSMEAVEAFEAAHTSEPEPAEATAVASPPASAPPVFDLPAGYEERFAHLLGLDAAPTKRTASQRN